MTIIIGPKTMFLAIIILLFVIRPFLPLVNPYLIESNHKHSIEVLNEDGFKCARYVGDKLIISCDTNSND
jgi:hypothetical protein